MKKITFIIALMLCATLSFSQQKDTIQYVTNTDTEKIIDKYSTQLEASIATIAEKLKQPAEHVYGVLVKQAKINGWIYVISIVVGILFFSIGAYLVITGYEDEEADNGGKIAIGAILCIIFGLIFVIGLIAFFANGLSNLLNPEYAAIQDILSVFK